ncbi:MAG: epoxyqueuosine reductase QueH [Treponema sp.]|nr:epoxyqueuosine reductase QueH [Treponema sp.]
MRLLFHCCCSGCAIAPIESLISEGIEPTLFWYNPNIHPSAEYQSRLEALRTFAQNANLPLIVEGDYDLLAFMRGPGAFCDERQKRCAACYSQRLDRAASVAAELGIGAFGTSLTISPYQNLEQIRQAGEEATQARGVAFMFRDFRPLFQASQNEAREMGLYRQKYCGCIFSEAESYAQTQARNKKKEAK